MEFSIYNLQEVPFEKLEDYGLSRLMIQDLPENVMQRFLMGYPTPALPFSTEDNDGKKVSVYAQISLIHKDDKVDFLFAHPLCNGYDLIFCDVDSLVLLHQLHLSYYSSLLYLFYFITA